MKLIFDIFRWMIGLLIVLLASELVFTGTLYFFEFIARTINHWNIFAYAFTWLFLFGIVTSLIVSLFVALFKVITLIVRQKFAFTMAISIVLFLFIWAVLILFWTGMVKFSWEDLNHKTANKFLFSIFYLSLLYVPLILIGSVEKQNK